MTVAVSEPKSIWNGTIMQADASIPHMTARKIVANNSRCMEGTSGSCQKTELVRSPSHTTATASRHHFDARPEWRASFATVIAETFGNITSAPGTLRGLLPEREPIQSGR
jgi:hypothetical protein